MEKARKWSQWVSQFWGTNWSSSNLRSKITLRYLSMMQCNHIGTCWTCKILRIQVMYNRNAGGANHDREKRHMEYGIKVSRQKGYWYWMELQNKTKCIWFDEKVQDYAWGEGLCLDFWCRFFLNIYSSRKTWHNQASIGISNSKGLENIPSGC